MEYLALNLLGIFVFGWRCFAGYLQSGWAVGKLLFGERAV
jgi:hypothetical protein